MEQDVRQPANELTKAPKGTLRRRILAFVGALILLSMLGSTISLYRITEVNRSLDAINRVLVPLGRVLTQANSDATVFRREVERGLGYSHWSDPHWKPRPIPRWIDEILESEVKQIDALVRNEREWAPADSRKQWRKWAREIVDGLATIRKSSTDLHAALSQQDLETAASVYPELASALDHWMRRMQWATGEHERATRGAFASAEARVSELTTGLEIILVVVVSLSLLLLWFGERALRPLAKLTRIAREITLRGPSRDDKSILAEMPLSRSDEVSQLAREFHRMATALLEREKTVELQKTRLQDQNQLLREMGELNENVLNSIESVLLVTDPAGRITQCNPVAARLLGEASSRVLGTELLSWEKLVGFPGSSSWVRRATEGNRVVSIEAHELKDAGMQRTYGGRVMPLRHEGGEPYGAILVLDDLTEELDLQERLRHAENLAAVGRLSAQVAHEVRNPLHSIGLEAEIALETASRLGSAPLKQALGSILGSVDRLEKITENYLKLSRLSSGEKSKTCLSDVLESTLATYAQACESEGVQVEWSREPRASFVTWGDRDLLEQVLGNLFRNAIQAVEGLPTGAPRCVAWKLGNTESGRIWIRIEDTGPGVPPEVMGRLFTPFVTSRAQGTGLGLSFVKKVVEDHGGTVIYRDLNPGACFEILLPAYALTGATESFAAESFAEERPMT